MYSKGHMTHNMKLRTATPKRLVVFPVRAGGARHSPFSDTAKILKLGCSLVGRITA